MEIRYDPERGLPFLPNDGTGAPRLLACLPQTGPMALPNFGDVHPIIPESKWVEIDLFDEFNPPMLDQGGHGSCVGHGGCTAFTLAWQSQGEDLLKFSPCYLYGNINGGRDQGADIGQTIQSLMQQGICLEDTVPEGMVYRRQFPGGADQEAAQYKLVDGYRLNSPEEKASAIQMGWPVADSVMVGGRFNNLDSDGVVGVDRGPGNHCICAGGMKKINGVWHYRNQNSWSDRWGQNGYFYTNDRHIQSQGYWVGVAFRLVSPGPNAPKFVT